MVVRTMMRERESESDGPVEPGRLRRGAGGRGAGPGLRPPGVDRQPDSVVGSVVGALISLNPTVYLVVLGFVGILFTAYGVLYLPTQADGR